MFCLPPCCQHVGMIWYALKHVVLAVPIPSACWDAAQSLSLCPSLLAPPVPTPHRRLPSAFLILAFQVPNDPTRPDSQPLQSQPAQSLASTAGESHSGQQRSVATTVPAGEPSTAAVQRGQHSIGVSTSTVCPTVQVCRSDPSVLTLNGCG